MTKETTTKLHKANGDVQETTTKVVETPETTETESKSKRKPDIVVELGHGFTILDVHAMRGLARYKQYDNYAAMHDSENEAEILKLRNQAARTNAVNDVNRVTQSKKPENALMKTMLDMVRKNEALREPFIAEIKASGAIKAEDKDTFIRILNSISAT